MKVDYTGQRFGVLTALEPTDQRKRNAVVWRFQCDCGTIVERKATSVKNAAARGATPSCGFCDLGLRSKDYTGQKFGKLTAIERVGHDKKYRAIWTFECECGAIVQRTVADLQSKDRLGYAPSCGNAPCANFARLGHGVAARNGKIRDYRVSASKAGREFTLTDDEMIALFTGNCHYCGKPPSAVAHPSSSPYTGDFVYNGIDRLDSNKGYTPENVVSCCWRCNHLKRAIPYDEFILAIGEIYEHLHG